MKELDFMGIKIVRDPDMPDNATMLTSQGQVLAVSADHPLSDEDLQRIHRAAIQSLVREALSLKIRQK